MAAFCDSRDVLNLSLTNIKLPAQQYKADIYHLEVFLCTFHIYYDLFLHVHL